MRWSEDVAGVGGRGCRGGPVRDRGSEAMGLGEAGRAERRGRRSVRGPDDCRPWTATQVPLTLEWTSLLFAFGAKDSRHQQTVCAGAAPGPRRGPQGPQELAV